MSAFTWARNASTGGSIGSRPAAPHSLLLCKLTQLATDSTTKRSPSSDRLKGEALSCLSMSFICGGSARHGSSECASPGSGFSPTPVPAPPTGVRRRQGSVSNVGASCIPGDRLATAACQVREKVDQNWSFSAAESSPGCGKRPVLNLEYTGFPSTRRSRC